MPCWLVWWWRDTTSLPASTHPQLTASSLASSRTLEAAPVLSPRRWLFRGTPTQHKQLSGAWRYNPAAVQWKHFENKQNSSYLRDIYAISTQYLLIIYWLHLKYLQYICYVHTTYALSAQYLCNIYTISTQYLHDIYAISTQDIYAISTRYLHRISKHNIYTMLLIN